MIVVLLVVVFVVSWVLAFVSLRKECTRHKDARVSLQECREKVLRCNARTKKLEDELKEERSKAAAAQSSRDSFKSEVKRRTGQYEKLQEKYVLLRDADEGSVKRMADLTQKWREELDKKEVVIKSLEHRLGVAQKDRQAFLSELTTAKSIIRNLWEPVKEIEAAVSCLQELEQEDTNA